MKIAHLSISVREEDENWCASPECVEIWKIFSFVGIFDFFCAFKNFSKFFEDSCGTVGEFSLSSLLLSELGRVTRESADMDSKSMISRIVPFFFP